MNSITLKEHDEVVEARDLRIKQLEDALVYACKRMLHSDGSGCRIHLLQTFVQHGIELPEDIHPSKKEHREILGLGPKKRK